MNLGGSLLSRLLSASVFGIIEPAIEVDQFLVNQPLTSYFY